jgi:activator of 2-hydroxyglutaryl-CoA dehydratase
VSSKCGIFAEADSNTLVKSGVPVEEIIASLYEAVVYQNLATLTKGNTPVPEVLLLGGPNMFFTGLQQAWRHHLAKLWKERKIALPEGRKPEDVILIPADALYYACLGCIEIGQGETNGVAIYQGMEKLRGWIDVGQHEQKAKEGSRGLIASEDDFRTFCAQYDATRRNGNEYPHVNGTPVAPAPAIDAGVFLGCDFGSTTAKAVVLCPKREMLFSCYVQSKGNPIEDAKAILRQIREAGFENIAGLAITGYGKDLLRDIIGADVALVETVAHATAALHFHPDADVICDVGGCDVKIMLLRQGTVSHFRLNSQCSSGNGAFLQGVADAPPPLEYRRAGVLARSCSSRWAAACSCGRTSSSAQVVLEISLARAVLPLNVWSTPGAAGLAAAGKVRAAGRRIQPRRSQGAGGLYHRRSAARRSVIPTRRSGAIDTALCARDGWREGTPSRYRGFDTIEALQYESTTNEHTICKWCPVSCRRTFIDVVLPGAKGRPWSKVPLAEGKERVISGNTCPKGLLEDANEMRVVKAQLEEVKRAHPNVAEMVREDAFRHARVPVEAEDRDT